MLYGQGGKQTIHRPGRKATPNPDTTTTTVLDFQTSERETRSLMQSLPNNVGLLWQLGLPTALNLQRPLFNFWRKQIREALGLGVTYISLCWGDSVLNKARWQTYHHLDSTQSTHSSAYTHKPLFTENQRQEVGISVKKMIASSKNQELSPQ